jgi:hypothetical protein
MVGACPEVPAGDRSASGMVAMPLDGFKVTPPVGWVVLADALDALDVVDVIEPDEEPEGELLQDARPTAAAERATRDRARIRDMQGHPFQHRGSGRR